MLSMTTDYVQGTGCPEPYLRQIAAAGFTHIHWCHQWNTDFLYADPEIEQIATWMRAYGLQLCDLHASAGVEKGWTSAREYERQAGVELVKNRIWMTSRLSGDVIIMHARAEPSDPTEKQAYWQQLLKSLDEIEPYARERGVCIALENLAPDNFDVMRTVLSRYDAEYVGICYDSGHGNLIADGLGQLDGLKGRLISVHLHDNDGSGDQHRLMFSGTVDWERLARIMATSAYTKPVSMELSIHPFEGQDREAFLAAAFETGTTFAHMIDAYRQP